MSADSDRPYPSYIDTEQYSILRTFIAGKLEAKRDEESGDFWKEVNADIESLAQQDPAEAFRFAISTLDRAQNNVDPEARFRQWWQGTSLAIMSHPNVEKYLIDELQDETSKVIPQLSSFLDYKPPELMTNNDLADHPEGFNLVMTLLIMDKLKDKKIPTIQNLQIRAQNLLRNQHIRHLVELYHEIDDDKELVDPIYQITSKPIEVPAKHVGITLRQFTLEDAPHIFVLINNDRKHLSQYGENTSDKYKTLTSVEESIIHPNPDKPFRLRFGIWNDKNQFVGSINLTPEKDNPRKAEIGYYLGSKFTGKGYMLNAALTLSSWAFLYDGVDEIYGVVHKDNAASAKVLMKAGYTETGKEDDDHTIFTLIRPGNINQSFVA